MIQNIESFLNISGTHIMTQAQQAEFNIDDLLDSKLDDLEDLPEFKPYPNGAHKCIHTMVIKTGDDKKTYVEGRLKLIEHVELSDPTQELASGAECTQRYDLSNEFARGQIKAVLQGVASHFGTTSLRETIEAANNIEVLVVTKQRKGKKQADSTEEDRAVFTQIQNMEVI